jgi:prepilin-type processing-associated H-X9-DG protein
MTSKGMSSQPTGGLGRAACLAVVVAGAAVLAWSLTQEGAARDEAPKAQAELPADLARVPADATALMSIHLGAVWNSDWAREVRAKLADDLKDAQGEFERHFGLPLDQVNRLTLVIMDVRGPEPLAFVSTSKPYDRAKVLAALGPTPKEEKHKDHTFFTGKNRRAVYPLDGQTLVFGRDNEIVSFLDAPVVKEGNLSRSLQAAAGKHVLVLGVNVSAVAEVVAGELPPQAEMFRPLLKARSAVATVDEGEKIRGELHLSFAKEADAQEAQKAATAARALLDGVLGQGIQQMARDKDSAKVVDLLKQAQAGLKNAAIEQKGSSLQARVEVQIDRATLGMTLVEGVQKVRHAASRAQSQNNMKQIGLAMHNYHDTFGAFPAHAIYSQDGKPLLSWRVQILPFIEQDNLYKQFKLDEPWDSEHNKKLLAQMPKVYASPSDEKALKTHQTHYLGFHGKGAFFEGKQGIRITDILDGTSNTILIVEGSKSVPWTKPEDIPFDPAKPAPKIGGLYEGGSNATFCDGSVHFISKSIAAETLKALITRAGGEVIGKDF